MSDNSHNSSKSHESINRMNGISKQRRNVSSKVKGQRAQLKTRENFEFGNYNRYYGYRIQNGSTDPRIEVLLQRLELFTNKDILDIGCNIGHISYAIARDFCPKSVLGIDIDNNLIKIARKNLRFYCNVNLPDVENSFRNCGIDVEKSVVNVPSSTFPDNISFLHANYVLYSDDIMIHDEPKYDVILCLSVTKWIHLNWGDDGLKRSFKRVFKQLRNGGVFVLEAQPFESYQKKKLSSKLRKSSRNVKLFPSMFQDYLLNDIGFSSCETLAVPSSTSVGFQRPIQLFFKL